MRDNEMDIGRALPLRFQPSANASKCDGDVVCRYCGSAIASAEAEQYRQFRICRACDGRLRQRRPTARQTYRATVHRRIERAIPPAYRHARFAHLAPRLREALDGRRTAQGLLLWGRPGSGKTYALAAYIRRLIVATRGELRVERTTFEKLSLALRDCFSPDAARTEADVLRPLLAADVLILEDIGSSRTMGTVASDHQTRTITLLIDERLEQQRPTFLTSNLNVESLTQMFDERLGSRLHAFKILELHGRDRRQQ
ncbi:MAG: ATP-binding protein [Planctomycetota bacterium]|nr:ATP-binding protein [Planctomycetota bacterium]